MGETTAIWAILVVFAALFLLMVLGGWAVPVRLWVTALASGVRVGLGNLVGMRWFWAGRYRFGCGSRRSPPGCGSDSAI
jgi:hypothetical protein